MGKTENPKAPNLSSLRGPKAKPQGWNRPEFSERAKAFEGLRRRAVSMEYPSEILLDSGLFYEMEEMLATIVEVIGGSLKGREERDWTLEMLDALEPGIDVDQKTLIRKFSLLMLSEVGRQYGGEIGAALVRTAEMLEAEKVPSDWKSSLTELRSQVEQDGKGREDDPWVLLLTENLIDGDDMNAFYEVFDLDGINIKTAIADQMIAALRETSSSDG